MSSISSSMGLTPNVPNVPAEETYEFLKNKANQGYLNYTLSGIKKRRRDGNPLPADQLFELGKLCARQGIDFLDHFHEFGIENEQHEIQVIEETSKYEMIYSIFKRLNADKIVNPGTKAYLETLFHRGVDRCFNPEYSGFKPYLDYLFIRDYFEVAVPHLTSLDLRTRAALNLATRDFFVIYKSFHFSENELQKVVDEILKNQSLNFINNSQVLSTGIKVDKLSPESQIRFKKLIERDERLDRYYKTINVAHDVLGPSTQKNSEPPNQTVSYVSDRGDNKDNMSGAKDNMSGATEEVQVENDDPAVEENEGDDDIEEDEGDSEGEGDAVSPQEEVSNPVETVGTKTEINFVNPLVNDFGDKYDHKDNMPHYYPANNNKSVEVEAPEENVVNDGVEGDFEEPISRFSNMQLD